MKKIALLTSGGDAPGMNAAIRAVVRKAIAEGIEVYGIHRGYEGLLHEEMERLCRRDVGGIINRGGTMLKTARSLDFKKKEEQEKAYAYLQREGIEALVVIGGDGSMAGAMALSNLGLPTITIPGTIDNDMKGTHYTIGFDTTLNTVIDAVSKIRDTTTAHDRVAIVEVMGRHAGHIAVHAGLACGAEIVLVPENPLPLHCVAEHLHRTHESGKGYSIILVAEGAYSGYEVCDYIKEHTPFAPNVTVLGYLQRGGSPSAKDSIMASLMSECAINCLKEGTYNVLTSYQEGKIIPLPYEEVGQVEHKVDDHLCQLITVLGY